MIKVFIKCQVFFGEPWIQNMQLQPPSIGAREQSATDSGSCWTLRLMTYPTLIRRTLGHSIFTVVKYQKSILADLQRKTTLSAERQPHRHTIAPR